MDPETIGIFEDMKIRNFSPLGDIAKTEGIKLREHISEAKHFLTPNNLLGPKKFYTEDEYVELYEIHSGKKLKRFSLQLEDTDEQPTNFQNKTDGLGRKKPEPI